MAKPKKVTPISGAAEPKAASSVGAKTLATDEVVLVIPHTQRPVCWVRDADTPYPYMVNESDFDPAKHTKLGADGKPLKEK